MKVNKTNVLYLGIFPLTTVTIEIKHSYDDGESQCSGFRDSPGLASPVALDGSPEGGGS